MVLQALEPLHPSDWVVFGLMMCTSLGIGVYYACTGGKQKTTSDYLQGNKQMQLIPITISLMVSFISTVTMLGYPAEMYTNGVQFWLGIFGHAIGASIASFVFVPVFYPLKLVSVNEYLLKRYESHLVRAMGTFCSITTSVIYTGTVFFGPSIAIEAVTGFPAWGGIMLGSVISVVYTTIGGFRAVIWTDVFQSGIMFLGMLTVVTVGIVATGGITNVANINYEWGRLKLFDFDPDPTKRINFYGAIIGNALTYLGSLGYAQTGVQRYNSLPTLSQARRCILLTIPGHMILKTISCACGLVVFAYYTNLGCDPLGAGIIKNSNQILPYFVVDKFRIPVLPGLFLSCLSAASLSSASSALNSCAANMWEDILKERLPKMKESYNALALKIMVLVFGIISTLIAILMTYIGGSLVQILQVFNSSIGGPLSALYFMGLLIPWINWKGASAGGIAGFCFGVWISIGSFSTKKNWLPLPTTTANCTSTDLLFNTTSSLDSLAGVSTIASVTGITEEMTTVALTGLQKLYSLSFLWMREAVTGVTITVALIVSLILGRNKPEDVNPMTIHPVIRKALKLKCQEIEEIEKEKEKFLEMNDNPNNNINVVLHEKVPVNVTSV